MPKYLQQRARGWYAVLEIPKPLRAKVGKPRFVKSLQTDSLRIAEIRVLAMVSEWKKYIEALRSGKDVSLEQKVTKWRQLIEFERQKGLTDAEIEDLSLDVIEPEEYLVHEIAFDKKHLLGEFIGSYIDAVAGNLQPKSVDMKRSDIIRFVEQFKFAQDATMRSLISWVEGDLMGKQGLSAKTCRRIFSNCRGYWVWLTRNKGLDLPQPFSGVIPSGAKKKTKAEVKDRRKHFTAKHYKTIKDAIGSSDLMLSDLITLAAYTGCRIEELCSLKLEGVTEDRFTIEDAKTEAGWRIIPIHSHIRQLVARLKGEGRDGYFLSGLTFNKYGDRSNAIGKRFGRLKTKCGYGSDYVFHSFRKGVATQLETTHVPENVTARLLGHDLNTMSYGLYSGGVSFDVLAKAVAHLSWERDSTE
jgi:integrase